MATLVSERDNSIDIIKGIAIILVLCGHLIQYTVAINGQDYFLNPGFKIIYTFHMPLFMFISGYLMAWSLKNKNWRDVFKNRCQTLLVPLMSWGILGAITSLLIYVIHGERLVSGAWFIWFLYTLFILSVLLLISKALEKYIGSISYLLIYVLIMIIPFNNMLSLYNIKWFYLFYLAGYFVNQSGFKISSSWVRAALFILSLMIFVMLISQWTLNDFIHNNQMNFLSHDYAREILRLGYRYLIGFLGIYMTFYIGHFLAGHPLGNVLAVAGKYAMGIYVIQRYLIEGIYPRLISLAHLNIDTNSASFFIVVPVLAIMGAWACVFISRTLFQNNDVLNRLFLGGRG